MPKGRKLKVYRTPIGFHDAYVAAPSQQAALKAWGSDANLFARGIAQEVTDPALMIEPLAAPGQVIRRSRGDLAEQLAALPANAPEAKPTKTKRAGKQPKPRPAPSRARLEEAGQALTALLGKQRDEAAEIDRREAALKRERRELEARQAAERRELEKAVANARLAYEGAIQRRLG